MIILGNDRPVFIIAGNPQEANNWTHRYLRYVRSHEILEGHHDPIVILVGSYYTRKDYDFLRDLIIANTRKSQENKEVKSSATSNTERDETATRLLKCFVNFWHSDDTEPNDVALAIVEAERFLSDVAASPLS